MAGRPRRGEAPRPRRQRLRHLRRLLLPGPGAGRGGRRRHRDGRGDVPHEVRLEGHDRPPARRVPRVEDHAGRAFANTKIEFIWNTVVDEILGDDAVTGARRCATSRPARRATIAADGVFMAIGHDPNTALFARPARRRRGRLHHRARAARPRPSVPGRVRRRRRHRPHVPPGGHGGGPGCKAAIDAERFLDRGTPRGVAEARRECPRRALRSGTWWRRSRAAAASEPDGNLKEHRRWRTSVR